MAVQLGTQVRVIRETKRADKVDEERNETSADESVAVPGGRSTLASMTSAIREIAEGVSSTSVPTGEAEDKECTICFDAEVSVKFSPCTHGACTDCVSNLRRQVVFKADKGLKCPYCRQFIQSYDWVGSTGESKAKEALKQANTAAKAAALAREPPVQQVRVTEVTGGSSGSLGTDTWICGRCRNVNYATRKTCNTPGCTQVAPTHILQHLLSSKQNLDVLKATSSDVQKWATIKLHPKFNAAFAEAGMPFDSSAAVLRGDDASVQAAMKAGSHKKLQRIIEGLLEGNFVHQLTTDFYGNYTLQDLIDATKRMRCAARSLVEAGQMAEAEAGVVLGRVAGRDYLGRLSAKIGKVVGSAITHPQGSYVVEKVLDYGDPQDILEMTEPVWSKPYSYTRHKYALHKYIKLVDKLGVYAFTSAEHKEECSAALDAICEAFLADDVEFNCLLNFDLGGPMLLDAAQGGLPNQNALRVLHTVASDISRLIRKQNGPNVLKTFLRLEARNAVCRELIVTNVCIMALKLESNFARTVQCQLDGPEIVRRMLELMSQEQDEACSEWASCIVSDLAAAAGELWKKPANKAVLLFALQLPAAAPHIADHLEVIERLYGDKLSNAIAAELPPEMIPAHAAADFLSRTAAPPFRAAATVQAPHALSSRSTTPPPSKAAPLPATSPMHQGQGALEPIKFGTLSPGRPPARGFPPQQGLVGRREGPPLVSAAFSGQPAANHRQPSAPAQGRQDSSAAGFLADLLSNISLDPQTQAALQEFQAPHQAANGSARRAVHHPRQGSSQSQSYAPPQPAAFTPPGMQAPRRSTAPPPATLLGPQATQLSSGFPTAHGPTEQPTPQRLPTTSAGFVVTPPLATPTGPAAGPRPGGAPTPVARQNAGWPKEKAPAQNAATNGSIRRSSSGTPKTVQATGNAGAGGRESWSCPTCTYVHAGGEANFLTCAICCTVKPGP